MTDIFSSHGEAARVICQRKGKLAADNLKNWLRATYKKTGRWPTANHGRDKPVYGYNKAGKIVIIKGEIWRNINTSLFLGQRGWDDPEIKGISQFRKKYVFDTDLTPKKLDNWLRATHEVTGRWAADGDGPDKPVYGYLTYGAIGVMQGEVWRNISKAISRRQRGWKDRSVKSVSQFRKARGLGVKLREEKKRHRAAAPGCG